jgi:xylan 1,4-beta-xylosidase
MRSFILLILILLNTPLFGQLVLPGDNPDPSVVKVGDTYWASATTSNWMPAYPILKSNDLIHWETKGFVFEKKPDWADYYFWAPEISYDNGKYYVYYSAHKKGGNLCLGIASADKPEGPYKDHGPMMCEEVGSIDAFPVRDNSGKLYLVWKEDGNSVGKPTPIWAMQMNEERTALIGEKKELFRNDASWEANLVEGVAMIKHGDYYYAFYAGAGCCGNACTYGIGVARAKELLGPWEKYNKNPLMTSGDNWKCPGHGTTVEKDGKFYFLFHGYDAKSNIYTGREGLLKEFTFTDDGWIKFSDEKVEVPDLVPPIITDDFTGKELGDLWQWSVFQEPKVNLNKGRLELQALGASSGAFLGHKTFSADYTATVSIVPKETISEAGLALIGDDDNMVAVSLSGNKLKVWKLQQKKLTELHAKELKKGDRVFLKAEVQNGKDITFLFSTDDKTFAKLNPNPIDGSYLPPWDRAIRVGLVSKGEPTKKAVFEKFVLENAK